MDTIYDSSGRVQSVSNPHRLGSEPTDGSEYPAYDGLGRTTSVTHADGNAAQTVYGAAVSSSGGRASMACTGAPAYPVLSVDEAGKKRQVWIDGLGRIVETDEPDAAGALNLVTCNTYDLLNNLSEVEQRGSTTDTSKWRRRSYTYDALSRVTSATVPETGPAGSRGTTWLYYTTAGGSLCSANPSLVCRRTDPRSITITFSYDELNRLTGKTYSNGNPAVTYLYDQTSYNGLTITNGKGRRTGMSDVSGMTAWSYDTQGRVLTERRTIAGITKVISYTYTLGGSVASITYPSGRVLNYSYNNAGRLLSVKDPARTDYFASDAVYTPDGLLKSFKNGKVGTFVGITTTNTYNNRLQPTLLSAAAPSQTVLSLSYGYGSLNNGNVAQIQNNRNLGRSVTYAYDQLNRLLTAQSQATSGTDCWGNSYGYDDWANLLSKAVTQCTSETLSVSVNEKNQIVGMSYDLAGNLTNDGIYSYSYDAENRMTSGAGATLTYDGDGRRVKKSTGKLSWTGIGYAPLAESDLSGNVTKEFFIFAGRRIGYQNVSTGSVYYSYSDHLTSARVITNSDGSVISEESDFYPWGGERVIVDQADNPYKFTTYERGSETALDYAVFRTYSSRLGRFLSPDPLSGSVDEPQSLNLYTYVQNNPCNLVDYLGLEAKKECTVRVSVSYVDPGLLSPSLQQRMLSTLKTIFNQAGVEVDFVQSGADVSVQIGVPIPQSGAAGINYKDPAGMPMRHSSVDFGKLLGQTKGTATRGFADALARVSAHELGHALFLPHSPLGGLMAERTDPFQPLFFTDTDAINLQSRCDLLRRQGGGAGGGRGGGGTGGLSGYPNGSGPPGWGALQSLMQWINSTVFQVEVVTHKIYSK